MDRTKTITTRPIFCSLSHPIASEIDKDTKPTCNAIEHVTFGITRDILKTLKEKLLLLKDPRHVLLAGKSRQPQWRLRGKRGLENLFLFFNLLKQIYTTNQNHSLCLLLRQSTLSVAGLNSKSRLRKLAAAAHVLQTTYNLVASR